jgi:flavoprotein
MSEGEPRMADKPVENKEAKIREILEGLKCILEAHDSCAELTEFKDNKAVVYCGGPCVNCDNRCIEDAIKEKFPNVEVIIR